MSRAIEVVCPICHTPQIKTAKSVNAVIRRSGRWACKPCATRERNVKNASPIGSIREKKGYILERTKDGWALQHRLIMERILGRKLKSHEIVHHINHIKTDNRPENLLLMTDSEHTAHHNTGKKFSLSRKRNISKSKIGISTPKKLNKQAVMEIRNRYAFGGISYSKLAKEYAVTKAMIGHIIRKITWRTAV